MDLYKSRSQATGKSIAYPPVGRLRGSETEKCRKQRWDNEGIRPVNTNRCAPMPSTGTDVFENAGAKHWRQVVLPWNLNTSTSSPGQRLHWQRSICTKLCKGDLLHKIKREEGSLQTQLQCYPLFPPTATCSEPLNLPFYSSETKQRELQLLYKSHSTN